MVFKTQIFSGLIDLLSKKTQQICGNQLVAIAYPLIEGIIKAVQSDTFDYTPFSFKKNIASGLTGKSGLYLIINRKTKRVYLGGAANLAQRKGEHKLRLSEVKIEKQQKLAITMRQDLNSGSVSDFYFVPMLFINSINIINTNNEQTLNKQIAAFLDNYVENPLLTALFQSPFEKFLYNVKTVGDFQVGNTFGGAPNSGAPSKPICYKDKDNNLYYAWESVSAAAASFNVSTKLIRVKREQDKMSSLTKEEFNNFTGVKITNDTAKFFATNRPEEYQKLLFILFPKKANKNG